MIIGSCFEGDNDTALMMFQHERYYQNLQRWVDLAGIRIFRYRTNPDWKDISWKWKKFREGGAFDHRTVQAHHDLIAAHYRHRMYHDPFFTTLGTKTAGWFVFFCKEAIAWLDDERCLKLFLTALACSKSEEGYRAEDVLAELMREKYHVS